jgi:hypothetical protein
VIGEVEKEMPDIHLPLAVLARCPITPSSKLFSTRAGREQSCWASVSLPLSMSFLEMFYPILDTPRVQSSSQSCLFHVLEHHY